MPEAWATTPSSPHSAISWGCSQAHTTPSAAGTGTFGYEPNVSYFFGFPRAITPGGVAMDIPLVNIYGTNDGDKEKQKQYVLQTGILSSALEHAVPEQMFVNEQNPGEAISAVKALQKASQQGQRIYHITKDNQWTILGNIHHDQATMDEIRNALNAGKEVITHTSAVSVPGWSGAGYIITDPTTGAGAYKIAGGGNGGYLNLDEETLALISGLSLGLAAAAIAGLFSLVTITPLIGIILFLSVVDVVLVALYNLEIWSDGTDRCFGVGFAIGAAYARLAFATFI